MRRFSRKFRHVFCLLPLLSLCGCSGLWFGSMTDGIGRYREEPKIDDDALIKKAYCNAEENLLVLNILATAQGKTIERWCTVDFSKPPEQIGGGDFFRGSITDTPGIELAQLREIPVVTVSENEKMPDGNAIYRMRKLVKPTPTPSPRTSKSPSSKHAETAARADAAASAAQTAQAKPGAPEGKTAAAQYEYGSTLVWKTASAKQDGLSFGISSRNQENGARVIRIALSPVTTAADIVTSPIQIMVFVGIISIVGFGG